MSHPDPLERKREQLLELLADYRRVVVAFSAGVDSTVVAKAAQLALGQHAVAVTASSPSLAAGELHLATQLAEQIGIRHLVVKTNEFDDANYLKNASDRCLFCKTDLYSLISNLLPELEVDVIVNGANVDDRGDHRPGMQAATNFQVRSPLIEVGMDKHDVRQLARTWDLRVWDKPATPCLSSRIAYGIAVTPERVRRIDRAEQFVRETFGLTELRVRLEANETARIEVPIDQLCKLVQPEARQRLVQEMHELGFTYVTIDLEGFRSGSMNEVLPEHRLQVLD